MKNALVSICVTAIMTAVYRALAPTDKFGSQVKLLISCFFVVSVIGAVSGAVPLLDISGTVSADTSYNDYSVQLEKLTAEETANNLRRVISERLAEEGIAPEKIYVGVNISDKGSISISEVGLVFRQPAYDMYAGRAVVLVHKLVGTKTKVTAELPAGSVRTQKEREER